MSQLMNKVQLQYFGA